MKTANSFVFFALAGASVLTAACDGDPTSAKAIAGASALVRLSQESPGANCGTGGVKIEGGSDANSSGVLDNDEVVSTQYACNGGAGSGGDAGGTGATGATGANGSNGTNGAIGATGATGATGANGTNGAIGATGATGATGTNGSNGSNGAIGATGATGSNGSNGSNGAIGATGATGSNGSNGAIGATGATGSNGSNGATGATGHSALVAVTAESAGANCASGGQKVTSGLDSNSNGVLDAGEITATNYVCNGANATTSSAWIGVDFGDATNVTPLHWTASNGSTALTNLIDQSGAATTVGLSFSGSPASFNASVLSSTIPMGPADLSNIGGNLYNFGGSLGLDFTGLTPGAAYGVYVMGLRGGASPHSQAVSIVGVQTVSFTQGAAGSTLSVNDQVGADTALLTSSAKYVRATSAGGIAITVGGSGYFVAGVALQKL